VTDDRLLLGVDGGNSKTIALLARADGTIVGAGRAGACDHYVEPLPGAAYEEVAKAISAALEAAGAEASGLERAVLSLAGADWPEDCETYAREVAARLGMTAPITVVNDALGALRGGTDDGVGVAIVCGTGTAVGARAADGRIWNVSFWAEPSYRYSLARGAVEATLEAELGIAEPTLLQQLVPASTGHGSVEELLRAMTLLGRTRPPLAKTAVALLDAAEQGDATAHRVVREVAHAMVQMARVSARRVGLARPSPLVLAGGLFRHPSDLLEQTIAVELPGSEIVMARFEPAVGALLMAFDEHGSEPDLERMTDTIPPPELYATISVEAPTIWL
jgi:N-acetylglucosamine kinase-like BadF-type ATPase